MFKNVSIRERLKAIREEAGLTLQEVADELGVPKSSYQHYEDRYKKEYLPLDKAQSLALVFMGHGIEPDRVLHLAGYNRDLDIDGEEADELGVGPSPLGPNNQLISDQQKHKNTSGAANLSRNLFTIGFEDDLIIINARVDQENLGNVIKRLQAIYHSS